MEENDLLNILGSIYNVDETCLQIDSRQGAVITEKGSTIIHVIILLEKGEAFTTL